MRNFEAMAEDILQAAFVDSTTEKVKGITKILEEAAEKGDCDTTVATDICDYLQIARRGNRSAIRPILNGVKS